MTISKSIALLGACAALVAFTGCGDDDEESGGTVTTPTTSTTALKNNLPAKVKALDISRFTVGELQAARRQRLDTGTTPTGPQTTPTTPPSGQILDNARLEAYIKQRIEQNGFQVQSVDCDDNVPIQQGRVSYCIVTLADGRQGRLTVTQVDNNGTVRIEG